MYHKARKCYFASASTVCGAEAPAEAALVRALAKDTGKLRTWSKLFRGFDQVAATKGLASFKCRSHFQRM
jgi:hypothetical protein